MALALAITMAMVILRDLFDFNSNRVRVISGIAVVAVNIFNLCAVEIIIITLVIIRKVSWLSFATSRGRTIRDSRRNLFGFGFGISSGSSRDRGRRRL
jgi:hypothetical protein